MADEEDGARRPGDRTRGCGRHHREAIRAGPSWTFVTGSGPPLVLVWEQMRNWVLVGCATALIGLPTVQLMAEVNASALAIDARKTLLIDRDKLVDLANQHGISIVAFELEK